MIEINTAEDIKLIKEFSRVFSNIDEDKIVAAIDGSNMVSDLIATNKVLLEEVNTLKSVQKNTLETLNFVLKELEGINKVKELEENNTKGSFKQKTSRVNFKKDHQIFEPYSNERKEYQLVTREGKDLVHIFTANKKNGTQKHLLPINLFEFLVIAEAYIKGQRSIKFGEVKELCELFGLTRPQFSKIYYNLSIGKFDGILADVEKIIEDSIFTIRKSHIYRNNHDVNIDKKEFNELLSIYVNSESSFLTIYKLIKENEDIDPFDLLVTLKKSEHVSKAISKVV